MKFLIDMNLAPRWAEYLLGSGWDAVHWSNIGDATAADSEIMAFALANDYVVLTHDLDCGAILAITHGKKTGRCADSSGKREVRSDRWGHHCGPAPWQRMN
jgi:predicted nuclease of predicted toxin-antitoxin system